MQECRPQRTLAREAEYVGIGIHTGAIVTLRFCPAPPNTGILFRRVDLPGAPIIPASVSSVCETARSTTIGVGEAKIHTVEHVLAAVRAFNIDNLIIEVDGIEPPVGNGSSDVFVEMIEHVGIVEQEESVTIRSLEVPVYHTEGDIHIVAVPCDTYRISYTLSYSQSKVLRSQFFSTEVNQESFVKEIAPCRTFSMYEEIAPLMERGLIKGGSLANAVIIKGDAVFSKGGLFFSNEMVRHKILDLIGDLSLVGIPFKAHVMAIRSGHATNVAFAEKIKEVLTSESSYGRSVAR